MSRLKELRLHGFKSFADPTRFAFEPGVNAVIGPNGSGKSNMADAVRWVLGEQSNRSLRTRRADDVIFAGSDGRRPQGMAEAILVLDNADGWLPIDFAEVSIGRRAYRSGETEYLINGARARLRDIVELLGEGRLGANELVVVGQGTVDAALSLRPEERRQLFEEAAGVKGLQVKRNEASVRLDRARENLSRVGDLIGELRPQVKRLALQAEHQQQHDTLGARARGLVIEAHRRRERAARTALGESRRAAAAAESELAAVREGQDAGRRALADAEERYWEADEAARVAGRGRDATREALIRAEGRHEAATGRLREMNAALERDLAELAEAESKLAADSGAGADATPVEIASADAAERAWRVAVADLAAADDALIVAEEALASARSAASSRIAAAARASEDEVRRQARHEHAASEHEQVRSALDLARTATSAATEARDRTRSAATSASDALASATAERDAAQAHEDETRHEAQELDARLRASRAELLAIQEPAEAARRLGHRLAASGWAALLDTIDPPEASWAALEAVVGGELEGSFLLGEADPRAEVGDAHGAARLLAPGGADGAGRDAALDAVDGDRTLAEWVGATSPPRALEHAVVARDLAALLDGWRRLPSGWVAVTPEGDLADARGIVVVRGRADAAAGLAARAHARRRELAEGIRRLEAELQRVGESRHAAAERLRRARDAHLGARESADAAERDARRAVAEQEAAASAVARLVERETRLAAELAELEASDLPAAGPGDDAAVDAMQAAADRAREERDARAARRDEARNAWSAARDAAREAEAARVGHSGRAVLEARVAQLRASIPTLRRDIDALRSSSDELAAAYEAARGADAEAAITQQRDDALRDARRAELRDLERGRGADGSRVAELEDAAQATAIEASRRDEVLLALGRERELALDGLPETAAAPPMAEIEALDDEALDADLRRVRRTLGQIGSVNPFAVEEHSEVAGRLDALAAQDADLRGAIGSTEELIGRLEAEIGTRFDAAFRAIGEKFDEYCQLLFAGGSASLQMADEADGDAPGGIEIVVRPPGKRLQRLAMLSGGERALTGVALLFAMLTVNPVPFCILDEVDAALDEANIGRFADALRRLAESIDFVVITHNRATIEVADTIYGVTMTDAAVSRVLSLRLADVPVEVGA